MFRSSLARYLLPLPMLLGLGSAQTQWVEREHPEGEGLPLFSVAWTGKQLVAVGTQQAVMTSTDGITWVYQGQASDNGANLWS